MLRKQGRFSFRSHSMWLHDATRRRERVKTLVFRLFAQGWTSAGHWHVIVPVGTRWLKVAQST